MPEMHVFQWTAAFGLAIWLTARWFLRPTSQRWRHIAIGTVTTLLWIPVAYTAGNVGVADGGQTVAFGSTALATFSTFMVFVCFLGLVVGLVLWVEDAADEAHDAMPRQMQHGGRD